MRWYCRWDHRRVIAIGGALLSTLWATTAVAQPATPGQAEVAPPPVIRPALDGIFEAFQTHPLVGLGERHNVAQLLDFYRTLVRDPRFATEIGHVVVEFGGAAHQDTIDRYVNGEAVPYDVLRQVWDGTVGWQPTVTSPAYAMFFAQIRQTNQALPPAKRIRVWLGEPPIDWSKITTNAEYRPIVATRDSHAAALIVREILKKNRKALVIYGGAHFDITQPWENAVRAEIVRLVPDGPMRAGDDATLRELVEREFPGSFFVAQSYAGFRDEGCMKRFEERFAGWPIPALAMAVRGTTLEADIRRCLAPMNFRFPFPPTVSQEDQERLRQTVLVNGDRDRPLVADAMLFYAPAGQLTVSGPFPDLTLDEAWRAELDRRAQIITGQKMPPGWLREYPAAPVPFMQRD